MGEELEELIFKREDILDSISDWIVVIDNDCRIIYSNNSIEKIIGISKEEVIGKNCCKLIHDSDFPLENCPFQKMKVSGKREIFEIFSPTFDKWFYITVDPVFNNNREIIGAIHTMRDITENKKTEEALKESEDKFRRFFNNIQIGAVIAYNPNEPFTVNQSFADFIGYSISELESKPSLELVKIISHPDDYKKEMVMFKKLSDGEIHSYRMEKRYIKKNGNIVYGDLTTRFFRDEKGSYLLGYSTVQDITEKKKIEEAKFKEKVTAEKYLNLAGTMMISLNRDGNIILLNNKGYEILGYNKGELLGKNWFDTCLPKDIVPEIKNVFKRLMKGEVKAVEHYENQVIRKDGEKRIVSWYNTLIKDDDGNFIGFLCSGEDITDRRKAEAEIKYKTNLLDNVSDAIISTDIDFNIISWNKGAEIVYGWKEDEVIGKPMGEIVKTDFLDSNIESVTKDFLNKGFWTGEVIQKHKDGSQRFLFSSVTILKDNDGKAIGSVGVNRDITDRKKAEEKLIEIGEKFRNLMEQSPLAIQIHNQDGKLIQSNAAYTKLFAFNEETLAELYQKYNVRQDEQAKKLGLLPLIEKVYSGEEVIFPQYEYNGTDTLKTLDFDKPICRTCWIQTRGFPLRGGDGKVTSAVFLSEDITEKKKAEESLKDSEEKFKNIAEQNIMGVCILQDNVIKYTNKAMANLYGYTVEEVLNWKPMEFYKLFTPETLKIAKEQAPKKQSGDSDQLVHYIVHGIKKNGDLIWVDNYSRTISYQNRPADLVTQIDITNKKIADEALKESEEKYRSVIENVPVVSWKTDKEGHTAYISPNVKSVYGFTPEEIYSKGTKVWFDRIHPDDTKKVFNGFKLLFDKGRNFDIQYRIQRKDGKWIWLHDKATKVKEENGKFFAYGAFSDITEGKLTEEKLNESRGIFKTIVETAPSLLLISDKYGNVSYISPNSEKFTGYNAEEFIGKVKWWVHPDDIDKCKKLFEKTYKDELSGKDFQYKAIKKNGDVWYASSSWEPLKDNSGNFHGIVMQTIDITERRRREKEILKQFMRYELSEGNCYLILEKSSLKSIKAFNDLLKIGLEGIILSREKKIDLKKHIKNNFNYMWIAEKQIKESIHPNNIEKYVESIQKSSVIFIDRIDFIIQKISFKKTLTLLQRLNEIAYMKNHVILLSIDPATIADDHLYLIKKEIQSLEPKRKIKLNDEQIEILKFIFEKNVNNIKPSYSEIGNYLKESKPTIRKKIRYLKSKGYLIENIKGSRKTLEISEKTRNILT